jgi:tripartite-type tricarboxylate transporter receptor subunit TctC
MKKRWGVALAAGLLFWCAHAAMAQRPSFDKSSGGAGQAYPTKPIRLIVPFAPGGGNDIVARIIGQRLTAMWGQVVIVDNRPGAGGNVAGETTARAAPDGYTAFQFNIANTIAPSLYKDLRYDPLRDFAPVTQIAASPFIVVVPPGAPVHTISELIALGKQAPGKWSYASSGIGGASHLGTELFKVMTGTDFVHVPYGGGAPALNDVIAGRVQIMFAAPAAVLAHLRSGRVRGIAVSGAKRVALVPELPTIAEAGVKGYESSAWYGLVLPARTPSAVVTALNGAVVRVLGEGDVEQKMTANGMQIVASSPAQFTAFIRDEVAKWARVVKVSKASVN